MLRRLERTKVGVEPATLSLIAIEFTHSTRFTPMFLLRIQRYMWRNHVATWAWPNNSDRNVDLNKIWSS